MIPKVIHYCWFGKKEKPKSIIKFIETWRSQLPNYEIKEWNESNFNIKSFRYTREAYAMGHYAFVSDVVRLYALSKEGGIYLDTDVEVIGSFDAFLKDRSFVGYETELIGTGIIGAEPGTEWTNCFLNQYKRLHFIDTKGFPILEANTLKLETLLGELAEEQRPCIYPYDVFCACDWRTKLTSPTERTVSIHHYMDSWNSNNKNVSLTKARWNRLKGLFFRYIFC